MVELENNTLGSFSRRGEYGPGGLGLIQFKGENMDQEGRDWCRYQGENILVRRVEVGLDIKGRIY